MHVARGRTEIALASPGAALDVTGLCVSLGGKPIVADVALRLLPGEVLGVVGESGSGKSTLAHAILGLLPPGASVSGTVSLGGGATLISQHPMAAFSPVLTIGAQLSDLLGVAAGRGRAARRDRILALLAEVGIADPARVARAYPFQLSGGMLQRVAIGAAMSSRPALLVADEPTTALDVTIEAHILHLLRELGRQAGTAILLITHQMDVVASMADRMAVMYGGRVVEEGPAPAVLRAPAHPYTRALLASDPAMLRERPHRFPTLRAAPAAATGCGFAPRCPHAATACAAPPLRAAGPFHSYGCVL